MKLNGRIFASVLFVILCCKEASAYKILFLTPIATKSMKNVFDPLINALAKKGHEVFVVSPVKSTNAPKTVQEIISIPYDELFSAFPDPFESRKKGGSLIWPIQYLLNGCRRTYENPDFQNLLVNNSFDLVILNGYFNDCMAGILYRLQVPFILYTTSPPPAWISEFTGTHLDPSFVPTFFTKSTDEMTFSQRVRNNIDVWILKLLQMFYYYPQFEALYREYLGTDVPGVSKILSNVSMLYMNANYYLNYPRPLMPNNIELGGIHCRPAKPLPTDLDDFLSGANNGFIYFSLGSVVQGKNMPEKARQTFLSVFSKMKQRVIWKWESEYMPDLPSNVKLSKWLPQQDVLGHPNIKVFISHGGLLSTQESVYHGVPMLGIPIFADQDMNMIQAEMSGYALVLEILRFDEDILLNKLERLINEPQFTNRAKYLSKISKDQKETPGELAVFWTEYVIRHKGAPHLRSAARNLNFFQANSWDVFAFFGLLIYLTCKLISFSFRKFCGAVLRRAQEERRSKTD